MGVRFLKRADERGKLGGIQIKNRCIAANEPAGVVYVFRRKETPAVLNKSFNSRTKAGAASAATFQYRRRRRFVVCWGAERIPITV